MPSFSRCRRTSLAGTELLALNALFLPLLVLAFGISSPRGLKTALVGRLLKLPVLSPLIGGLLKHLPACFTGRGSSPAAAPRALQIARAPPVSTFLPDTLFVKVIWLLLLEGFGSFPDWIL